MLVTILFLVACVCAIQRPRYSRLTAQDIPPGVEEDTFFTWRREALMSIDVARYYAAWGGIVFLLLVPAISSRMRLSDGQSVIATSIVVTAILGCFAIAIVHGVRAKRLARLIWPKGKIPLRRITTDGIVLLVGLAIMLVSQVIIAGILMYSLLRATMYQPAGRWGPVDSPAPNAAEAPKYEAQPADAAKPPATSRFPITDALPAYGLPLVYEIDAPDAPKEIQGPSPPLTTSH